MLDEALKKSTVVWVEVPGEGGTDGRAVPVWYGTLDGRVYVLVGGSEQHVPGLAEATQVTLVARSKEQQSLVAEVEASARVVDPRTRCSAGSLWCCSPAGSTCATASRPRTAGARSAPWSS